METEAIHEMAQNIAVIKEKIGKIEVTLEELDQDFHTIKPEYLEKLKNISQQKGKIFEKKEEFIDFLEGIE